MPELPEVEVTRQQLEPVWTGQVIERVWAAKDSYFFLSPPAQLRRRLKGRRTERLTRHGKYILAELDDDSRLLCHLGMTGQVTSRPMRRDLHVHLQLELAHATISFRDVRKFGKVQWLAPGQSSARLNKLGPDALRHRSRDLAHGLYRRGIPIKTALLDQSILAGVGNIYADEALFAAKVSPLRASRELAAAEITLLSKHVRRILKSSVQRGGSTINDYLQPDGRLGSFQGWHRVYGKEGLPCPRCKTAISRVVLAARSTHFCSGCQR